jgi:hypothetical protein
VTCDYDSTLDTVTHILRVQVLLSEAIINLHCRAINHDLSKLQEPEKSMFDRFTPILRDTEYGTDEYKRILGEMQQTALQHHYEHNSHHPEYYEDGVRGMSLFDVLEMLVDWKAAGERRATGDIWRSLELNQERWGLSDDLVRVLANTIDEFCW